MTTIILSHDKCSHWNQNYSSFSNKNVNWQCGIRQIMAYMASYMSTLYLCKQIFSDILAATICYLIWKIHNKIWSYNLCRIHYVWKAIYYGSVSYYLQHITTMVTTMIRKRMTSHIIGTNTGCPIKIAVMHLKLILSKDFLFMLIRFIPMQKLIS